MRVTEKGQVTIPKPIRDRLGIGPGSEVDFHLDRDGVRLVRADRPRMGEDIADFSAWAESVKGTFDTGGLTADAYLEWLRGPRDDIDPR